MKRQMICGCAVAAAVLAASSGCSDRPGMDVASGAVHAARNVIEIELGEWTTYTDRHTTLACAVLRSSTTGQLRDPGLAGIVYSQAMAGRDAGVQSAAGALYEAAHAGTHTPDIAKLMSGMRTACYMYELRSTSVAGSGGHFIEVR